MKFFGDLNQKERVLVEELIQMERYFEEHKYSKSLSAKAFISLAHDWYSLHIEEEGERLLLKAAKIDPGYFSDTMSKHMSEDKEYEILVRSLTHRMAELLLVKLHDISESGEYK